MTEKVWITGVGAVTPLGDSYSAFAENVLAGRSGAASHNLFEAGSRQPQTAAAVGSIPTPTACDPRAFQRLNRLEQLALSCAAGALDDAGLRDQLARLRVGLVLGLGAEALRAWELDELGGRDRVCHPSRDPDSVVHCIHRELGLDGPAVAVAAACASAGYALALARRWVQVGLVDACLAGGCDLITPMAYAGFHNLRALSRRGGDPAAASRPFDADRDGFVMGEGGAVFVLQSAATCRRRGARPYAELAGFGSTSDASHMVIPCQDPQSASRAIRLALEDARLDPADVDYVNAHAAGTPVGDRAEAHALQLALGSAASDVPVSSTKSMTGHLLSGAAAVEALACLVALSHQALPPTINLDHPDPECSLHHVPHQARTRQVRVAASNSFGFGGSNTCIILRKAA
jgi:3-oxoacyl-[acyl-carrier-protein] synthase II